MAGCVWDRPVCFLTKGLCRSPSDAVVFGEQSLDLSATSRLCKKKKL